MLHLGYKLFATYCVYSLFCIVSTSVRSWCTEVLWCCGKTGSRGEVARITQWILSLFHFWVGLDCLDPVSKSVTSSLWLKSRYFFSCCFRIPLCDNRRYVKLYKLLLNYSMPSGWRVEHWEKLFLLFYLNQFMRYFPQIKCTCFLTSSSPVLFNFEAFYEMQNTILCFIFLWSVFVCSLRSRHLEKGLSSLFWTTLFLECWKGVQLMMHSFYLTLPPSLPRYSGEMARLLPFSQSRWKVGSF